MPYGNDEQMLATVRTAMGADTSQGGFQLTGDLETDKQALVQLYQTGDPNDPATQQRWEQAKQEFVDEYGEDELPDEVAQQSDTGMPDDQQNR